MQSEARVLKRRDFIKTTAAASLGAAAMASTLPLNTGAAPAGAGQPKFCAFEKPLTFLSHDEMADFMAETGYDGVEVAVRPGGRVEPENVEQELPRLAEALKRRNLEITILTSGINRADQPHTEKVLRTAAKLGVKRYRMLWYRYDLNKPIFAQVEELRPVLKDLVQMNRDIGITGLYQKHSGASMLGAAIWDIYLLINEYNPEQLGLAYDLRHSQVEAGVSWSSQFHLAKSHIGAVCAKDFTWDTPAAPGAALGKGRVDQKVMGMLAKSGFKGPYSVHVEYLPAKTNREECARAFKEDLATLRKWVKES